MEWCGGEEEPDDGDVEEKVEHLEPEEEEDCHKSESEEKPGERSVAWLRCRGVEGHGKAGRKVSKPGEHFGFFFSQPGQHL